MPVAIARTPRGTAARYAIRSDTSDGALVGGIVEEDEYGLAFLPELTGWAIDVGAHIGTVAVALAMDHPGLRVVAVEALPENVAVLRETVRLNGLEDRVFVHHAAAAKAGEREVAITYGWERADNQPDEYMHDNRFIGGMVGANETSRSVVCQALSLAAILDQYAIDRVALLKIDCEGCEWFFLDSPEVGRIDRILGELHWGKHGGAKEFRALLEPTHTIELDDTLVVAHFDAVAR